jgi:hypothetical protein
MVWLAMLPVGSSLPLVVDVVGEGEGERAVRDGRGLVGGVVRDGAADAGGADLVAVGVVRERRSRINF